MPTSEPSYSSVWARPAPEGRSTLTRAQIVTAAMELLDREGIDGLSMRNLATELGVGATTIYWHVANRHELLELVVNEVYGEIAIPDVDEVPDWRTGMWQFAHDVRATVLRHPWTVNVLELLAGNTFGPNVVLLTENMLVMLEGAGFELREAERVLNTVAGYVLGIAMTEAAWRAGAYRHELDEEAMAEEVMRLAEKATENAPRMRDLLAHYQDVDLDATPDEDFAYGLERVLDGLQSRLDSVTR